VSAVQAVGVGDAPCVSSHSILKASKLSISVTLVSLVPLPSQDVPGCSVHSPVAVSQMMLEKFCWSGKKSRILQLA